MNFPRYWAKANRAGFVSWEWSNVSQEDAQTKAIAAAEQTRAQWRSGELKRKENYQLTDRPFREEIIQEISGISDQPLAVVSRNLLGCLVLNTASLMFVDVDFPEPPGFFGKLFGRIFRRPPHESIEAVVLRRTLQQAEIWCQRYSGWGWRVYRTAAGVRLMATHAEILPDQPLVEQVFDHFETDPLYRRLCKSQNCYRARLTPKPWRCDCSHAPRRWPWKDDAALQKFNLWDADYRMKADKYATCSLVRVIGNPTIPPKLASLVNLHDRLTRVDSQLTLA